MTHLINITVDVADQKFRSLKYPSYIRFPINTLPLYAVSVSPLRTKQQVCEVP